MKEQKYVVKAIWIFCLCCSLGATAQDVHFSQFYQNPILSNPALTGIFNEEYKVGVTYRNQWTSLPYSFKTTVLDMETKVHLNNVNDYISFGLLSYFDKAGAISYNTNGFYPAINYNKSIEDKYSSYISVGFTAGYITKNVDVSKMTFDNQYVGGAYNPIAPSGENINNNRLSYWDLGAGVTFNSSFNEEGTLNYYLGLAGYHLTTPKTSFEGGDQLFASLPIRWDASFGMNYDFDYQFGGVFYGNVMLQNPYREIIMGGMFKWTKPDNSNSPAVTMYLGAFYRFQDAIVPTFKMRYKQTSVTFSYDATTSSLKPALNSVGTYEISIFFSGNWGNFDDKHLCPRF